MTGQPPSGDPAEAAVGLHHDARAALRSDRADEAEQLCRQAIATLAPVAEVERRALSHMYVTLSQALEKLDRLPEALSAVDRACELIRDEPAELVKSLNERAQFLLRSGHAAAAMATLRHALANPAAAQLEPDWLGVMYDHLGWALSESGDVEGALEAHARAAELLAEADPHDRIISLLAAARAAQSGKLTDVTVDYFRSALALARVAAELSPDEQERYRTSCARAVAGRFADPEVAALFHLAAWTASMGGMGPGSPWEMYAEARRRAADAGDPWVAMLAHIKLVELWGYEGDLASAARACRAGLDWARDKGLAPFAGWFASELAHLRRLTGLADNEDEGLLLLAEAEYYFDLHAQQLRRSSDVPATTLGEQTGVQINPAVTLNALGGIARDFDDPKTALDLFARAIKVNQELGIPESWGRILARCNHLLALNDLRTQRPQDAEVQRAIEADIASLDDRLAAGGLSSSDAIAARTALHLARPWPSVEAEIAELRSIADIDYVRAAVASNDRRPSIITILSRRLAETGRHTEAWETLQRVRARSLLAARTASVQDGGYRPPTAVEAGDLLRRTCLRGRKASVLVDVVSIPDGLGAYLVDAGGKVDFVESRGDLSGLAAASRGDEGAQAANFLQLAREDEILGALADRIRQHTEGADLLVSVDDRLANLPWASVTVDGGPWSASQLIGRIPAVAMLRFEAARLSGRSLVAGDSANDLPAARRECRAVAALLGAGRALLGERCTADAVAASRDDALDFLHIAVHGYADSRRGGRATLLMAEPGGGAAWVPFASLAELPWHARVVVFSGCSTAVGGPRNGEGLYGIAHTAMTHGADTVIATLWPVNDGAAAAFMTAFYAEVTRQLGEGDADLRLALRAAADAYRPEPASSRSPHTRDARELLLRSTMDGLPPQLPHQQAVSDAFVVIGDPILRR